VELFDREHNIAHLRRPRSIADPSPAFAGLLHALHHSRDQLWLRFRLCWLQPRRRRLYLLFPVRVLGDLVGDDRRHVQRTRSQTLAVRKVGPRGEFSNQISCIENLIPADTHSHPFQPYNTALRLEKGSHQGRKEQGRIDDARAQRTRREPTTIRFERFAEDRRRSHSHPQQEGSAGLIQSVMQHHYCALEIRVHPSFYVITSHNQTRFALDTPLYYFVSYDPMYPNRTTYSMIAES
jgi:hypothetical protein